MKKAQNTKLPLHGKTVSRCYVDSAFGIQFFEADEELTLRIESSFYLLYGDNRFLVSPQEPEKLCQALTLLGKEVDQAFATKDGELHLRFADDTGLIVPPDENFEAWEFTSSTGRLLMSLPSGGLASWATAE